MEDKAELTELRKEMKEVRDLLEEQRQLNKKLIAAIKATASKQPTAKQLADALPIRSPVT